MLILADLPEAAASSTPAQRLARAAGCPPHSRPWPHTKHHSGLVISRRMNRDKVTVHSHTSDRPYRAGEGTPKVILAREDTASYREYAYTLY